jgi:hypothetical protein
MSEFLVWMLSDGQKMAVLEGYTQLPEPLLASVKSRLPIMEHSSGTVTFHASAAHDARH